LDEASVLRSYGSQTYQKFLTLFDSVKYRFVATATPSPNKSKELIHYAGFLGITDTGQALTRFFQRNSTKANELTLHPHMENEFYAWLHSWAVFVQRPSNLGYSDDGYDLPELQVFEHEIKVDSLLGEFERDGQGVLIRDSAQGLKEAAREKRGSIDQRIEKMLEIIAESPDDNFILWHDLEDERRLIKKVIPEAIEVYGSLDIEEREKRIIDFSEGNGKYLATKPKISGSGCNFQHHCHKMIFLGVGYKFHDFIQAIHRIYRFLQEKPCEIHIIYMETEREIVQTLMKKWDEHNKIMKNMENLILKYGLNSCGSSEELKRDIHERSCEEKGEGWTAIHNDCVKETKEMRDNSIKLIVTSIPFGNHYEYSSSYNDFGHNESNDRFFEQMDFLTPELLRILEPGRVAAIHVKDRIMFGNVTGYGMPTVDPFHAHCIFHYLKHGFVFFAGGVNSAKMVQKWVSEALNTSYFSGSYQAIRLRRMLMSL